MAVPLFFFFLTIILVAKPSLIQ